MCIRDRGRPIGTLSADRLRLEASRAARTLTLVLENGYERRAGERRPFSGRAAAPDETDPRDGSRRIPLSGIDPLPWIEACPELFAEAASDAVLDDGRWDHRALRAALNELLRADASNGWHRVQGFGGVQGSLVRDVQLAHLDREGALEKRIFADRMSFAESGDGIEVLLEDGAFVRGEQKTPFPGGRHRIFLPRADLEAWRAARVPGLGEPSEAPSTRPHR